MKKLTFFLLAAIFFFGSCGMLQSIMKSTFPYTADVVVPASATIGDPHTVVSTANSYDQDFTKDGNNANQISEVRIISAKIQSKNPSDYNIGNIAALRVYMAKADGSDEVLVAIRKDITANTGNSVVLDIDNSHFLDEIVREKSVRIRMVYVLRKAANVDAELKISLSIGAEPRER